MISGSTSQARSWCFTQIIDFALAAGLYTASFDVEATNSETGESEGEDGVAPFPLIGLRASYLTGPRWTLDAYAEYFTIDTSDGEGTYLDLTASASYRFGERLSAGIAYNRVDVDGEDKKSDDEGFFDYSGAVVFIEYSFN